MGEIITSDFVKKYTHNKVVRHPAYYKTVDIYDHLRFHVDGFVYRDIESQDAGVTARNAVINQDSNPYFEILIGQYRPGEDAKVMRYRKTIYTSVTKNPCFKVITSLKKIFKSEEFKISYAKSEKPAAIKEGEQLKNYAEKDYPKFNSIENWFYSFGLQQLIKDPNAVVYTVPHVKGTEGTAYNETFTKIAHSNKVLDYKSNELAVIESTETVTYTDKKTTRTDGKVIYVFQPGEIVRATQISFEGGYNIEVLLTAENMPMQAYRAGFGELCDIVGNEPVYNSYISPMLPYLDKMARENSDLDAAVVRHLHPREWEIVGTECGRCKGTGSVVLRGKNAMTCQACKGVGMLKSPFTTIPVKNAGIGDQPVPIPPAGIIERDTEIINLQDKRVADHGTNALASINMEFLADNPLNESGVAKEIDRDELNNFVFGVAWNAIKRQMVNVYQQNAEQRYWVVLRGDENAIKSLLPQFTVPTKFDLLSDNTSIDQLNKMIDAGVDQTIITERQMDLVDKLYRQEPDTRKKLLLAFELNPFPSMTGEQLDDALLTGTITKRDAIQSRYIDTFIMEACQEDSEFLDKEFTEQKAVIDEKLTAKLAELEAERPAPPSPTFDANGNEA